MNLSNPRLARRLSERRAERTARRALLREGRTLLGQLWNDELSPGAANAARARLAVVQADYQGRIMRNKDYLGNYIRPATA